jgi:hypothetical protein
MPDGEPDAPALIQTDAELALIVQALDVAAGTYRAVGADDQAAEFDLLASRLRERIDDIAVETGEGETDG